MKNLARARSAALGATLLSLVAIGCGSKPSTPSELMAAADKASMGGDQSAALKFYDQIVNWSGEGAPSDGERFKASLEAVKSLVDLKQTDEALVRYQAMYDKFDSMKAPEAYRNALAVLDSLSRAQLDKGAKGKTLVALVEIAEKHHAEHKEKFQKIVKAMMKDVDDENMAKLKSLGYL